MHCILLLPVLGLHPLPTVHHDMSKDKGLSFDCYLYRAPETLHNLLVLCCIDFANWALLWAPVDRNA
jgi:hypothetical protein